MTKMPEYENAKPVHAEGTLDDIKGCRSISRPLSESNVLLNEFALRVFDFHESTYRSEILRNRITLPQPIIFQK